MTHVPEAFREQRYDNPIRIERSSYENNNDANR